jgi:putative peptide zinc metalloprotease protein
MAEISLPGLREDLQLHPGPDTVQGEPTWTIHDPVRNKFISIGDTAYQMLSCWHTGSPKRLLAAVRACTGRQPKESELLWLFHFLRANSMFTAIGTDDLSRLYSEYKRTKKAWATSLMHSYLYFRIPLIRPDRFLNRLVPLTAPFFSNVLFGVFLIMGVLGLLLAFRQWDAFVSTFMHFYSAEGLMYYGLAMISAKVIHEFGHGLTAARYGLRIPTMGAAFIVLWPVLYTDAGDAWKLADRSKRLKISGAGMVAELYIACTALFLWSFLPDGPLRSAAFILATVTWIMTLGINLNPLMRFDGYYLLSDILDVPNLQPRAFALARWRLREALFGFGEEPPERFSPAVHRRLLLYAYATWVYRFFLFIGIALIVYHLFFKVLGMVLFGVEILWFIAFPVYGELRQWWGRREKLRFNRQLLTTLVLGAGLAGILLLPWQSHVQLPAVMRTTEHTILYAPAPALVEQILVKAGDTVRAGQGVAELSNPALQHDIHEAALQVAITQKIIARQAASAIAAQDIGVLRQQLMADQAELDGLLEEQARLTVRSPMNGRVNEVRSGLHVGRWVEKDFTLARVIGQQGICITAFVPGRDLNRIHEGTVARFIPDDVHRPTVEAVMENIAPVNTRNLTEAYLSSEQGGSIPVRIDVQGRAVPTTSYYRVSFKAVNAVPQPEMTIRGIVRVPVERRKLITQLWRTALSVLIRESGL